MEDGPGAELRLPASPRSPRLAREFADRFLRDCGHLDLAAAGALVVSELVTNVMVHTRGGCVLRLRVVPGRPPVVRVEVEDTATDAEVKVSAEGSGLRLVADNSRAWGVARFGDGKTVWAELA